MAGRLLEHWRWLAAVGLAVLAAGWAGASEVDYNPITPSADPSTVRHILEDLELTAEEKAQHYLLEPANTTSPRDTLISFIKLTQRLYELIATEDYSPTDRMEVKHIFEQLEDYFDLRHVAPSFRGDYASASAIYLREIIDRVGLPPIEEIPDEKEMRDAVAEGYPGHWQIPGTPFEIYRIDSGAQEGHYLFSEDTLTSVKPLFTEVRGLPYRAHAAEDFYYHFFLTPNPVIPRALIESLPGWAFRDYHEQTVWQWASMFLILLLSGGLIGAFRWAVRRFTENAGPRWRLLGNACAPAFAIWILYLAHDIIDDKIFITGEVFQVVTYVMYTVLLFFAIMLAFSLGAFFADWASHSRRFKGRAFDAHLARLGIRIISIIICIVILIEGLRTIGFSLATVIAGASVTGLAVALAAQSTLRNVFGSLMILLDKPFRVDQRIKILGHDGVVEEIGLRSTKIRLLNGNVTSIPNDKVADAEIENIGMRPFIKRVSNIALAYGTPEEKVHRAVTIIREILSPGAANQQRAFIGPLTEAEHDANERQTNDCINHEDFPPRVFFNEFNADSLNILMIYWHHPPEYWDFLEFSQRINETIIRRFAEAGIEFAFPTQTIHIAGLEAAPFPQIRADNEPVTEPKPANE